MELEAGRHDLAVRSLTSAHLAARLPRLTGVTFRLAWQADPKALVALIACQFAAAVCAAFGLAATVSHLFANTPTPGRLRDAPPGLAVVVGTLVLRALLGAAVTATQAPRARARSRKRMVGMRSMAVLPIRSPREQLR
ncbi:hypothetical protein [Embleya sp. NPDC050493]|uniref:hypothetical protein n=1 Tax=Embleya sp. NPDC050493 TaxID=3363989 RepID=UPI00379957A4